MTASRRALIVANSHFEDRQHFADLPAAAADAVHLAEVLSDPAIGGFDVKPMVDCHTREVMRAVESFFADAKPEDTLLLHLSLHGWKDLRNRLSFVLRDTERDYVGATAMPAAFVSDQMSQSRSKRIVVLLDCCYSGAFSADMLRRNGHPHVDVFEPLQGAGRVVLTASTALQFAHERERDIRLSWAESQPSVFTAAVVDGLRDGSADADGDGFISVDELYDYVFDQVKTAVPGQTPTKSADTVKGTIYIARSSRPTAAPDRSGAEAHAWERLVDVMHLFFQSQMDGVLAAAVKNGASLFSADYVEVETWLDEPHMLIRGNATEIAYYGSPTGIDHDPITTAIIPLIAAPYDDRVGELRLGFSGPVNIKAREHPTLRAFARALGSAIRNATSYTQLESLADKHAHDATHDPLTGLPNRRMLALEGAVALEDKKPLGVPALLLIDLNHFKDVNDALGHSAGDQVIVALANRLAAAAHRDALVTRLGGDEFAILYRAVPNAAQAMHLATALMSELRKPVMVDGMPLTVSASGGVAMAPDRGGFVELLRRADIAMYQARRTNSGVAVYEPERDSTDHTAAVVEGMLPRAVAEKEFSLEFQPIADLRTGEPTAVEALARWEHAEWGRVDPSGFLGSIERSGLLMSFTDAVLDQALDAARHWRDAGRPWPVAVNLSPRTLLDRRLPLLIQARLDDHGLTGADLILELAESLTLSQIDAMGGVLEQLREMGCRLMLDDFGTGFSSLSMLRRVPIVQGLKIDSSFVGEMEAKRESAAVVRSTVELAVNLGLRVAAEGVQRESQRRTLWRLGCAAGQGSYFSEPVTLAALMRLPAALAAPIDDDDAGAVSV